MSKKSAIQDVTRSLWRQRVTRNLICDLGWLRVTLISREHYGTLRSLRSIFVTAPIWGSLGAHLGLTWVFTWGLSDAYSHSESNRRLDNIFRPFQRHPGALVTLEVTSMLWSPLRPLLCLGVICDQSDVSRSPRSRVSILLQNFVTGNTVMKNSHNRNYRYWTVMKQHFIIFPKQ
jgi:hypothetical protein